MNKNIILDLKNDIDYLEKYLNNIDKYNKKNKNMGNLKLGLYYFKLALPYILSAGVVVTGFSLNDSTPFKRDRKKSYLNEKSEYTNSYNITIEKQYANYNNAINSLILYDKWHLNDDGLYERKFKKYSLDNLENIDIYDIFTYNKIYLENILGKPILEGSEQKNKINLDELDNHSFKIILYSILDDDFIVVPETIGENISSTAACLLIIVLCYNLLLSIQLNDKNKQEIIKNIYKIKDYYKSLDPDTLKTKIKIKKDNYNKLVGVKHE